MGQSQYQSIQQIKSQISQLQKQVARIQNDIRRIRTVPITRIRTKKQKQSLENYLLPLSLLLNLNLKEASCLRVPKPKKEEGVEVECDRYVVWCVMIVHYSFLISEGNQRFSKIDTQDRTVDSLFEHIANPSFDYLSFILTNLFYDPFDKLTNSNFVCLLQEIGIF